MFKHSVALVFTAVFRGYSERNLYREREADERDYNHRDDLVSERHGALPSINLVVEPLRNNGTLT